jgi:hypothetical protein
MSKSKSPTAGRTFTVKTPMDEAGEMLVREGTTGEAVRVVDYVDEVLRERAKTLSPGSTVELEVAPTAEGEGYTLTRLLPGAPLAPFGAD